LFEINVAPEWAPDAPTSVNDARGDGVQTRQAFLLTIELETAK